MITLLAFALVIVSLALIVAGYVLAHRAEPQPQFAVIRNGYLPNLGQRKPH